MEDFEERQSYLEDQLGHVFTHGDSSLCLVCKQIISVSNDPIRRQEHILYHLDSSDHKESMRTLFKMCTSDPTCDTNDGKYVDIMTKSIFDISVLLGKEYSYICQKDKHLVCLMCKSSISEITSSFGQTKVEITQHLESAMHSNNIKEVCWYYRLNSKKNFLLFHKSILHCSVCQETVRCKETELLQSTVSHLESYNHQVRQPLIFLGASERKYDSEASLENGFEYGNDSVKVEQKYKPNLIKSKASIETFGNVECVNQSQNANEHTDIVDMFKTVYKEDKDDEVQTQVLNQPRKAGLLLNLTLCSNLDVGGQNNSESSAKATACAKQCSKKNKLFEAVLNNKTHIIKSNCQFVKFTNKDTICTLCRKSLSGLPEEPKILFKNLKLHFNGRPHNKNLEQFRIANNIKNVCEHPLQFDLLDDIKESGAMHCIPLDNFVNSVTESASIEISSENSNMNHESSFVNKDSRIIKDIVCHHKCSEENKVLDKCRKCIRKMFSSTHPEVSNFYISVRKNKCFCYLCGEYLCSRGFNSLMVSYLNHSENKIHKERMSVVLLRKERVEKIKERKMKEREMRKAKISKTNVRKKTKEKINESSL